MGRRNWGHLEVIATHVYKLVKQSPPDPYIDQFPLPEALALGPCSVLYDPYIDPYRE